MSTVTRNGHGEFVLVMSEDEALAIAAVMKFAAEQLGCQPRDEWKSRVVTHTDAAARGLYTVLGLRFESIVGVRH